MDPALRELMTGRPDDEIEAVIRIEDGASLPAHVRVVSRFGDVATCRLPRGRIEETWADESVVSLKAPRSFGADPAGLGESAAPEADGEAVDERRPPDLPASGRGVIVGVVDWGFDFAHPNFRRDDGGTRALAIWDQSAPGPGVAPYGYGRAHTRDDIDRALATREPYAALGYHPATGDPTGSGAHGTHVTDIAAGNGRAAGAPLGLAPDADLLFVHLAARGSEGRASLGDSVALLEALDWIAREAGPRPWVVNLSVGRHGGPHDGLTLVERGIEALLTAAPGRCVVQSAGNYYGAHVHASGQLRPGEQRTLHWRTDRADVTPNELEVWYSGRDVFALEIRPPAGAAAGLRVPLGTDAWIEVGGSRVGRAYHRAHDPGSGDNHVDIFLYPEAPAGTWQVELAGQDVADGRYHAWVERDAGCPSCQSRLDPDDADARTTTGTIANGFRSVAVGAYDAHVPERPLAPFSSSGPTRDGRVKPDLVAPGVRVLAARSAPLEAADAAVPLLTRHSGTSMASPHVTGTVALMFEAAGRPLAVHETRRLLLTATVPAPAELEPARLGSGYLDVAAAVRAARAARTPAFETETSFAEEEALMCTSRDPDPSSLGQLMGVPTPAHLLPAGGCGCRGRDATEDAESPAAAAPFGGGSQAAPTLAPWAGRPARTGLDRAARAFEAAARPSASGLFDAFVSRRLPGPRRHYAQFFEVAAWPGSRPGSEAIAEGDLLLRRGEGGLGHAEVVVAPELWSPQELVGRGLTPESWAPGGYLQVARAEALGNGYGFARRVLDREGYLPLDTLVLRPRAAESATGSVEGPCADVTVAHPPLLVQGAVHSAVREAQRKLNTYHAREVAAGRSGLPNAPLREDCRFGSGTRDAVLAFQRQVFPGQVDQHDGRIGPHTWAGLDRVGAPAPPPLAPSVPLPSIAPPVAPAACVAPAALPPSRTRTCCILAPDYRPTPFSGLVPNIADPTALGTHGSASEASGLVYTGGAGFADLGHLRDLCDMTASVFAQICAAGGATGATLATTHGNARLTATVPRAEWLKLARSICYDDSVGYEIFTYSIDTAGAHNSAFSPEDLCSNFLGTLVAERALTAGGAFASAVTAELSSLLTSLGAQPPAETRIAFNRINGRWVDFTSPRDPVSPLVGNRYLKRRNFDRIPWKAGHPSDRPTPALVTAGFGLSASFYAFTFTAGPGSIPASTYAAEITTIRADARSKYGPDYATP